MAKKPRSYSNEFKAKVVLEVVSGQPTPSEACRVHKVHMLVLSRWRSEFLKQALSSPRGG
ncbi:MAG: transposase [Acaryochloris sp. RU_4_1]|nr:transposase [Acaryochloris sp. SU_5_25]NJM67778.1 transposase [Acaryochloris sp. RU_4_1]NJN39329.1 transposase [Acaryochloridaceae cyanobacterium CSU_3_4]NJR55049.1 transposase [Acaryochloris sp. CRU_2_0]